MIMWYQVIWHKDEIVYYLTLQKRREKKRREEENNHNDKDILSNKNQGKMFLLLYVALR